MENIPEQYKAHFQAEDKELTCRFGHICTSGCQKDFDCPCQSDHCCAMTDDCEECDDHYEE